MNTERDVLAAIAKIDDLDGLLRAKEAVEKRLKAHMEELQQRIETLATHGIQLPRSRAQQGAPGQSGESRSSASQGGKDEKVYVHPTDPSKTWHGRGRKPGWLKEQQEGARATNH